jgi:aminoglycoside phosphotransferase (APT) family kinase protein
MVNVHTDKLAMQVYLAGKLVAAQFPQWAHLPVKPVALSGWDNRTFHLGDDMSLRFPSAAAYAAQVEKEQQWLPKLAPHLPLPISAPLAMGQPSDDYPWHWSVYKWLEGENASADGIADLKQFAISLAEFLNAFQRIDAADGPEYGVHNFYRGGPLSHYDEETRRTIKALDGKIDTVAVTAVWDAAVKTTWQGWPVWVHGDVSAGNLLIKDGKLSAVIDFGCSGTGDPACDLAIAWTFFEGESRAAFRATLLTDDATWLRGRGWALWKALITLAKPDIALAEAEKQRRIIDQVLHG